MMLVLSRKSQETIRIGTARVIVDSINGRRVKLAIDAPPDVRIARGEIAVCDSDHVGDVADKRVAALIEAAAVALKTWLPENRADEEAWDALAAAFAPFRKAVPA